MRTKNEVLEKLKELEENKSNILESLKCCKVCQKNYYNIELEKIENYIIIVKWFLED